MSFNNEYNKYFNLVEDNLGLFLPEENLLQNRVVDSMKYSLKAGGKRLRPVLTLSVCDLIEGDLNEVMPLACAIEMIHTYSLIHDDLPAMDNDDFRRGKPTNHKIYGEAMAILAGDALLNYAFEVMLENKNINNLEKYYKAVHFIAKSSGLYGMIGGQVIDIESEGKNIDINTLKQMHKCKTGSLFAASILTPSILYSDSESKFNSLMKYAECIGLAFQVKDDILDIEGKFEDIGKPVGSDKNLDKSTFTKIYGINKSKEILNELIDTAIDSLTIFGDRNSFLINLALYIKNRNK